MNDKEQRNDPYEKKLAEIVVEDRERQERDQQRLRSLRRWLGCTIVVMVGVVAAGGFAGRHLLEQYRDGIYAAEDVKQSDSPDESAEAREKMDQQSGDKEES